MSMMSLFRKSQPQVESQALIQAPSADLIKSDTEPTIPEQVEIECNLNPEQLAKYIVTIDNAKFLNAGLEKEYLYHLLKRLGCKQYLEETLNNFIRSLSRYQSKKHGRKTNLYWTSCDYERYRQLLPPRIINRVTEIRNNFVNPHDLSFCVKNFIGYFEDWRGGSSTDKSTIFFLGVSVLKLDDQTLIIDAWRGPTFSDEEARI